MARTLQQTNKKYALNPHEDLVTQHMQLVWIRSDWRGNNMKVYGNFPLTQESNI